MGKKLAVILGAGASHDIIPLGQRGNVVNQDSYEPPLTKDLMSLHRNLEQYLKLYQRAYTAVGLLRSRLLQNKLSLEELLRDIKDSKEESKIQQFRQIPFYLQHLFGIAYCHTYLAHFHSNLADIITNTWS